MKIRSQMLFWLLTGLMFIEKGIESSTILISLLWNSCCIIPTKPIQIILALPILCANTYNFDQSLYTFASFWLIILFTPLFVDFHKGKLEVILFIEEIFNFVFYGFRGFWIEFSFLLLSGYIPLKWTEYTNEIESVKAKLRSQAELVFKVRDELKGLVEEQEFKHFTESPSLVTQKRKRIVEKLRNMKERRSSFSIRKQSVDFQSTKNSDSEESDRFNSDNEGFYGEHELHLFSDLSRSGSFDELSSNEIQNIIQTLISQEFLSWHTNGTLNAQSSTNILSELQEIYSQNFVNKEKTLKRPMKLKQTKSANRIREGVQNNAALLELFESIGEWNFDTLGAIKHTKQPIFEIGQYIYDSLGITEHFSISKTKITQFLTEVEEKYRPQNFFHNSIHGADVCCSVVFLLKNGLQLCGSLLDLDIFAIITAALCHDIGHLGLNNAFLIASFHPLAYKYNDQSVLENMHVATTFKILHRTNTNICESLSKADFLAFRKTLIQTILATDLQKHFIKQEEFRTALNKEEFPSLNDDGFRSIVLQIVLKCADLGHVAKKLDIHKRWTALITKELYLQGEKEIEAGLPLTPLCDKSNLDIGSSQKGFLTVVARPLFLLFEEYILKCNDGGEDELPIQICCQLIDENTQFWEDEHKRYENKQPSEFLLDNNGPPLLQEDQLK
ncbi:unnamed protein product [Blepharisma stoltei]|uniref:Phosphodiesterase n=1 Tax=Blepharisma stoltei TaxID=1481888 RepID=A0AAU9J9N0_9CILI|nr:unnamed protein product [Blepharisma stoltei]